MKAVIDYKEFEKLLGYLEDKTKNVYEREVQQTIEQFLNEQVTTINAEILK